MAGPGLPVFDVILVLLNIRRVTGCDPAGDEADEGRRHSKHGASASADITLAAPVNGEVHTPVRTSIRLKRKRTA